MNRYVIDTQALIKNIARVKEVAGDCVLGVVKANGYGFGMLDEARLLQSEGISAFGITEIEDIVPLRKALGQDADILVMRSTALPEEARAILDTNCIATIGSPAAAQVLERAAQDAGKRARCHVKIDTGFSRYGFLPADIADILACYKAENLNVEGIYTHFSKAYVDAALTRAQLSVFLDVVAKIEAAGFCPGIRHTAASAALFNVGETKLDMVRIGSAFTGRVITNEPNGLVRVGHLEAQVIDIKTLPAGTKIGYGGETKVSRETRVAYVSAGTSEGFGLSVTKPPSTHQALSTLKGALKKRHLEVKFQNDEGHTFACPVLGEVDLSLSLADVTGANVSVGDIATMDLSPLMLSPKVERVWV